MILIYLLKYIKKGIIQKDDAFFIITRSRMAIEPFDENV
jgi:hypothetical protein